LLPIRVIIGSEVMCFAGADRLAIIGEEDIYNAAFEPRRSKESIAL
jgi:hypothetical protein